MKDFFSDQAIFDRALEEAAEWGEPRCRFIEAALAIVNLSWEDPKTRDEYVKQMFLTWQDWGPGRPNAADVNQARAMSNGSMSLCGVTTQNVWAAAGVDLPYLYTPYPTRFGSAVTRERSESIKVGAWVDALQWRRGTAFPEGGDAMIIGDNTPAMARGSSPTYQHELNVLAWGDGPQGGLMLCMDGGQPGTAFRTRGLVEVFPGGGDVGELWCSTVNPDGSLSIGGDGRPLNGRRAIGFVDVSKLPFKADAPSCKSGGGGGLLRLAAGVAGGIATGLGLLYLTGNLPDSVKKFNPWG